MPLFKRGPTADAEGYIEALPAADVGEDEMTAVRVSGKPCLVHAPDPRVRQAFAQAGLPVFVSERAALEALRDWRSHLAALGS